MDGDVGPTQEWKRKKMPRGKVGEREMEEGRREGRGESRAAKDLRQRAEGTSMRGPARDLGEADKTASESWEAVGAAQGNLGWNRGIPLAGGRSGGSLRPALRDWLTRSCRGLRAAEHARTHKWLDRLLPPGCRLQAAACVCGLGHAPRGWSVLCRPGLPKTRQSVPCRSCVQPTAAAFWCCPIGHALTALANSPAALTCTVRLPKSAATHAPSHSARAPSGSSSPVRAE
jgi:hypothetical protein